MLAITGNLVMDSGHFCCFINRAAVITTSQLQAGKGETDNDKDNKHGGRDPIINIKLNPLAPCGIDYVVGLIGSRA